MNVREPERIRRSWNNVERVLVCYAAKIGIVRRLGLLNREGWYMVGSFGLLVAIAGVTSTWAGSWPLRIRLLSASLLVAYLIDSVLVNTSIVFVTRYPIHPLRSVLLTFLAFVNVGVAFAALYALEQRFAAGRAFDEIVYFSFITLTTVGFGDITPSDPLGRGTVVAEVLTGLYFLAAVFSTVTAWTQRRP
jgi:hypothetical protein